MLKRVSVAFVAALFAVSFAACSNRSAQPATSASGDLDSEYGSNLSNAAEPEVSDDMSSDTTAEIQSEQSSDELEDPQVSSKASNGSTPNSSNLYVAAKNQTGPMATIPPDEGSSSSGTVSSDEVSVQQWLSLVQNRGQSNENWQPAIQAAIQYAAANGYKKVKLPIGVYSCEPSNADKASWESMPVIFNLPDANITIEGEGSSTVLKKGKQAANALAMFRTAFCGHANIKIANLKIQGNGNPGSVSGLVDGICVNGSSNGSFENITIDKTKRHGIYAIYGAENNSFSGLKISNCNREMLGCGIQFEGASYNDIANVDIDNIGSNGIDFNDWFPSGYYPANNSSNGSPYLSLQRYYSQHNKVVGGIINGTGVINNSDAGGGMTCNPDDDYYGINIIGHSDYNEFNLSSITNVRINGTPNTYASAVRMWNVQGNRVTIGTVCGTSNYIARIDKSSKNNSIVVQKASNFQQKVLFSSNETATENIIQIN